MALYLPARAKLNLHLRVLGRRADGYHRIETLFHALELHDDLWAEPAPGFSLEVQAAGARVEVGAGEDNLVLRAARAYAATVPACSGARLLLRKRVPAGAGLGGGSADAAATLLLLDALQGRALGEAGLHELAAGLGADVPFFLRGGSQWGTGTGEVLTPVRGVPARSFLLVVPPFPCATAEVYKNFRAQLIGDPPQATIPAVNALSYKALELPERFVNDLEAAAMARYPALAAIRDRVRAAGVGAVGLCGSGSTLFVAFDDEGARDRARATLTPILGGECALLATRSAPPTGPPVVRRWPTAGP